MENDGVLSIDIGMKNFAYCIIDKNYKIVAWSVLDIGSSPLIYLKIIENLKLYMNVSKVIIEKQPMKNVKMKQFENMLHCYFLLRGVLNSESPIQSVEIFNPQKKLGKSHVKGARNYRERKKIAVELCKLFLTHELQSNVINELFTKSKKDDLSDCLLQGLVSEDYGIDSLLPHCNIKTQIRPRKPTPKQCKKGYSKSNLKYIFQNTNASKSDLYADPNIKESIRKHYNGSINEA